MIRFLRDARAGRGRTTRLLLAVLAFVGTQAAFVRAAFPHVSRPTTTRVVEQNPDALSPSSVDEGRLPARGSRRGGPTVGTSAPTAPASLESTTPRRSSRVVRSLEVPSSFVPPPLFRPPRTG